MRRRDFSQAAMLSCATVTLGGVSAQALAQPTAFKEGTDYYKLGRPAPVDAPADKVEVVEQHPHPWIRGCFQGPRARGAQAHHNPPPQPAT